MIGLIAKIVIALNSNSRPGEMASGIAFGFWLALIPTGNLLWILLFLIAFFLKHNTAAMLLSMAGFRLVTHLADPILDILGAFILKQSSLEGFFTSIYNLPFASYSNFNNSIVMGSFVSGLVLWLPLFFLFLTVVKVYRKKIAPIISESKWLKTLKRVPFFSKIGKAINLEARL